MTSIPYCELPGLEDVYFEDSFVLGCRETSGEVSFALDLVLTPRHARYAAPPPDAQHCYRHARLIFRNPSRVTWRRKIFQPATDASGAVDFGAIDRFSSDGGVYRLGGSWGDVEIASDPPRIAFD